MTTRLFVSAHVVSFFLTRKGFDEESLPQMVQLTAARKPEPCLRTFKQKHVPVGLELIVKFKILNEKRHLS